MILAKPALRGKLQKPITLKTQHEKELAFHGKTMAPELLPAAQGNRRGDTRVAQRYIPLERKP